MAETQINKYSARGRLGRMDVDMIDISATLTGDGTSGDVMFVTTEIPNAVSVTGGRALLHSAVIVLTDHATDASGTGSSATGNFNLIFTSDSSVLGTVSDALGTRTVDGDGDSDPEIDNWTRAKLDGTCGIVPVTNMLDVGALAIGNASNCGIVLKAEAGSKSVYVWGATSSTNDYNGATITLRLGIIKD